MSDRELLEAAAKAAGVEYEPRYLTPAGAVFRGLLQPSGIANIPPKFWNPLTDDGDALRLAVALRLHFLWRDDRYGDSRVCISHHYSNESLSCPATIEQIRRGADPYAATRRAIVRAAAALAVSAQSPPAAP